MCRTHRFCFLAIIAFMAILGAIDHTNAEDEYESPTSITVDIRHRFYPNFRDQVTVAMGDTIAIGDTELFFEIYEFYPHFAIIDSTKKIVSLSHEPKNPAFRIRVLENDEVTDNTWAFYVKGAPHYARTSFVMFNVVSFDYRGTTHDRDKELLTTESE